MRRRFLTLDVFTRRRFAGNPLAVVLDAEALDGTAMQAIAGEFNLSETVFVLPPADPVHRARVRIFTPSSELPFAGHPTVGSAVALGRIDGGTAARDIVLEEGIGPVRCRVEPHDAASGFARFTVARLPAETGPAAATEKIAAALGIGVDDIGFDGFAPARWSAGVPFTFVPLRSLDAVGRCRPDSASWGAAFGGNAPVGAFMFCRQAVEAGDGFHARMFFDSAGLREDPATGSAAAALAGVIASVITPPDGEHAFVIEQGCEMGRPSLIRLSLTMRGGKLDGAAIGGDAIVVGEGAIEA
jgi:trans-2,3-dihydro-3-hydroxyanthranilate isomerase